MAIKLRQPIRIDPVDLSERTAVGIKFRFNNKDSRNNCYR